MTIKLLHSDQNILQTSGFTIHNYFCLMTKIEEIISKGY